ncbi:2-oxoglutarate and iron-dependent oxygenase domain-containing protein [Streptomyces sp. YGL11-2]|uniref:2-oxoglutarate and iron-dependent oxygenase domain-containing protein n=1 Tax=Streptomyces sp. YGL11-2 TaxID=3414028 RepID=UPI003CEC1698
MSAELLKLARRFFALPGGQRLAVENIHSPHFRGYTAAGRELTGGRMDWRELFDVGR